MWYGGERPVSLADVVERHRSLDCHPGSETRQEDSIESSAPERVGPHMFATIRRYDAIDQEHVSELAKKVDESLMPASASSRASMATTSSMPATAS